MRYLSVCSGIEAASVAWEDLGWEAVGFSEIEAFPSALLAHRFPGTPNFGDLTKHEQWPLEPGSVELLVGGTPCQSFSVAGLRRGMVDPRGNLTLTFLALANRLRPEWIIWENVPGVLSSNGGRDFGAFLGALGELGYWWAYRVLDAQFFGVAQRRRRVFLVANARDRMRAAAVLFEPKSLRGDTPAGGAERQGAPASPPQGVGHGFRQLALGHYVRDEAASTVKARDSKDATDLVIAPTVIDRAAFNQGAGALYPPLIEQSETMPALVARGPHAVAYPLQDGRAIEKGQNGLGIGEAGAPSYTVDTSGAAAVAYAPAVSHTLTRRMDSGEDGTGRGTPLVAVGTDLYNLALTGDLAATMGTNGSSQTGAGPTVLQTTAVRRLTPRECERLQGFPDDWTAIPYRGKEAADGPRYKAIGNSMAVPVMRWIGQRVAAVAAATEVEP